jgi:hypothetical protein
MRHRAQRPDSHIRQRIPAQAGPGSRSMHTSNIRPAIIKLSKDANLLEQIIADRPALVVAALLDGATVTEIAAVLGWDLPELRMAARRWAPRLQKAGQLTQDQCAALLAIVFEPAMIANDHMRRVLLICGRVARHPDPRIASSSVFEQVSFGVGLGAVVLPGTRFPLRADGSIARRPVSEQLVLLVELCCAGCAWITVHEQAVESAGA